MIFGLSPIAKIKSSLCIALLSVLILAACVESTDIGPNAPDRNLEIKAAQNVGCAIENQARCEHIIENRTLMARFFAPETLGGLDANEKNKGRRLTTKFIVEAAGTIQQCQRVEENAVTILKDIRIDRRAFILKGTAPLSPTSKCFLTPDPENS